MSMSASSLGAAFVAWSLVAAPVGGDRGASGRRTGVELFLDQATYEPAKGMTPGGVAIEAAPTPQVGAGFRLIKTLRPGRPLAVDLTAGLRVGGLGPVRVTGAAPGVAIRAGSQYSGLLGVAMRSNGPLVAGLGLEGRVSWLATQLDGEGARRIVQGSPWIRGFLNLWTDDIGRYLRLEGAYNLASRHFQSRTYANPLWQPWADPVAAPASISTTSFWEPKWTIGLAVGFGAPVPLRGRSGVVIPASSVEVSKPSKMVDPGKTDSKVPQPSAHDQGGVVAASVAPSSSRDAGRVGVSTLPVFRVYFRYADARLTHEALVVLKKWAEDARAAGGEGLRIEICGHTDWTGSRIANARLARRRAEAVAVYLVSLGFDRSKMDVGALAPRRLTLTEKRQDRAPQRHVEGHLR